jgi:hypothetical protein
MNSIPPSHLRRTSGFRSPRFIRGLDFTDENIQGMDPLRLEEGPISWKIADLDLQAADPAPSSTPLYPRPRFPGSGRILLRLKTDRSGKGFVDVAERKAGHKKDLKYPYF